MGRYAICWAVVFAVVGFVFGLYALSWGAMPSLPLPLLVIMCPAALLGSLSPAAEFDTDFMWLLMALNAILYGAIGILLAKLFRVDIKEP
ncbi:MAG TPA: hypothetical protein VI386_14160 [Candidatus Sulfotelmatobacter sp.]